MSMRWEIWDEKKIELWLREVKAGAPYSPSTSSSSKFSLSDFSDPPTPDRFDPMWGPWEEEEVEDSD